MFNCLPGAMLKERHTHECGMGRNCGRAPLYDTAGSAKSHRLFNQGFQVAGLKAGCGHDCPPHILRLADCEHFAGGYVFEALHRAGGPGDLDPPGGGVVAQSEVD